jgi:hypothetical protein
MWKHLYGDWGNIPAKRTKQSQPSDFRLPSNADSVRPHHRRHLSLVCISYCQSRQRQNSISIFLHRSNRTLVQSSVTGTGYHTTNRPYTDRTRSWATSIHFRSLQRFSWTFVLMKFTVFWDVVPCSHDSSPWWWRQCTPLKRPSTSMWLQGRYIAKALNVILAAVSTWNLNHINVFFEYVPVFRCDFFSKRLSYINVVFTCLPHRATCSPHVRFWIQNPGISL